MVSKVGRHPHTDLNRISNDPFQPQMIRLQVFGGTFLVDGTGLPASRTATQARIIGLLSLLAAAGRSGMTRERLVGILWPDASPRRARHSLTQAMYAARRALECDDLFLVSASICLNPDRITTDIGDFEDALAAGRDEDAVALYRGPFLDGFFPQAADFDRWVAATRLRLEEATASALERLIVAAEAAGDPKRTFRWVRDLAGIRPTDATVAIWYVTAAAAAGDRAAALDYVNRHIQIVRDEYDLEPDPPLLELAAALRTAPATQAESPPEVLDGSVEESAAIPADSAEAGPGTSFHALPAYPIRVVETVRPRPIGGPDWRLRPSIRIALLAVLAIVLLRFFWGRPEPEPVRLDQRVVVAPFRINGADASIGFLREGLVDLLSTRLADDPDARGVDAGAVLRAWRVAGVTQDSNASRETIVKLATQFGAERVIVGSVVGTASHATLNASVVEARTGAVGPEASVSGPVDSITALVDRLAATLLASQAGGDEHLAAHTSTSLPALRAYIRGLQEYTRGNHAVARDYYEEALSADSTFSLAALRLALTAARLHDYEMERRALDMAWRHRDGLSARDQMHLLALTGSAYPAAGSYLEIIRSWEAATRYAPNRSEAWFGLAYSIVASGAAEESSDERLRAIAGLERVLALDPNYGAALLLLARLRGDAGPEMLREWQRATVAAADSIHPLAPLVRWRTAAKPHDAEPVFSRAELAALGPSSLRAIVSAAQFDAVALADAERAAATVLSRAGNVRQVIDLLLAQHSLATIRGRPRAALEITRGIQRMNPASRAHLRLRVLDALYADGDTAAAGAAAREMLRGLQGNIEHRAADACVLAQWHLASSDTASARSLVDAMPSASGEPIPVSMPAPICRALLEAWLAVESGEADAKNRLAALDSVVLTGAAAGDAAVYGHILIARLYTRLADPAAALAAIGRRPYMAAAWPRYLATALREEAALAEEHPDERRAAAARAAFAALRGHAEPELRIQPDTAAAASTEALPR